MHVSVERLRVGLVVGAVLLVGVIATFLGYARFRAHRFLKELPSRMGAELRQETNGFTYSQTLQGHTVFTIHAAKAIQRKDGKVTLRDVGIVLYGRTQAEAAKGAGQTAGTKADLADRIYGKEFEYDQASGVVRAMGEVHIDLGAPAPASSGAKMDWAEGSNAEQHGLADPDDRVIHVKTSGLVYLQKLGVASTDQPIAFHYRGLTGEATGADYNADSGVLVLQTAVSVSGERNGRPSTLRAAHAELDRTRNQMKLIRATYVTEAHGAGGMGQETARADEVMVYGSDGSGSALAERMEARGSVVLTAGEGTISGNEGTMLLSDGKRPQSARLWGGVTFQTEDAGRSMQGSATEGRGRFDKDGRMEEVDLTGAVAVHQVEHAAAGEKTERELSSGRLTMHLAAEASGKQWLREAEAEGGARLVTTTSGGKVRAGAKDGSTTATSEMRGDQLKARFGWHGEQARIERVEGEGHTVLRRVDARGEDVSQGETLEAEFQPAVGATTGAERIRSAVQQGSVTMTHVGTEPGATPEHATADRAMYEGAAERTTLTGRVRLTDASSVLLAEKVSMLQATGDATATGSVRASYLEAGAAADAEPVHVRAERAEMERKTKRVRFFGAGEATGGGSGAGRRVARLWQGGSQVEAPVIEMGQAEKTLRAHGVEGGARGAVRTVLAGSRGNVDGAAATVGEKKPGREEVLRVSSRELAYTEATRQAEFTGGVDLEDSQGMMHSQQATVFLRPAAKEGEKVAEGKRSAGPVGAAAGFMGGGVERIVASGGVDLEQTGRRGQGEQVVYTADDGVFVMTGTPASPPRIVDEEHGTVVGRSLRFDSSDNSVMVSGDASGSAGHRVRTETRVKQER